MAADVLIDACLAALAEQTGLGGLLLDEHGCCSLEHSDGFTFTLMAPEAGDLVHLSSALMDLPAQGRESFYSRLLRLNFLLLETSGATLSIDEEEQGVFLCLALVRAQWSAERLLVVMANFLASSSRLRQRLLNGEEVAGRPDTGWIAG